MGIPGPLAERVEVAAHEVRAADRGAELGRPDIALALARVAALPGRAGADHLLQLPPVVGAEEAHAGRGERERRLRVLGLRLERDEATEVGGALARLELQALRRAGPAGGPVRT